MVQKLLRLRSHFGVFLGMNLQICFMNDAMSDSESPSSDSSPHSLPPTPKSKTTPHPRSLPPYPQVLLFLYIKIRITVDFFIIILFN